MSAPLIRAVSWNLLSYGKPAMPTRRGQHELLRFLRPDVVCLQEIYAVGADTVELNRLVASIAEALGMAAFAVPARHSDCPLAILWQPEYDVLSQRAYDLLMWHGLGVVRLDVGADVPLVMAVTHLGPWNPRKQLDDTFTLTGQLPPSEAVLLAADWNSFGADPDYDPEPDWAALPPASIARHVRWNDDPAAPPAADRRPAQLMQRSGFHDAAPTLRAPWKATGDHHVGWSRREDIFWTTRPPALRRRLPPATVPRRTAHRRADQPVQPRTRARFALLVARTDRRSAFGAALPVLVEHLHGDDEPLRSWAVRGLEQLDSKPARHELHQARTIGLIN